MTDPEPHPGCPAAPVRSLPAAMARAVAGLLLALGTLLVLLFFDGRLTALYWQVNWPLRTVAIENFFSTWGVSSAVIMGIAAALLHDIRQGRAGRNARRAWSALTYTIVALLVQAAVVQALKYSIGRARPCAVGANVWVFIGPNLEYDGFPSGHLTATLVASLAVLRFHRRGGIFLVLWSIATAWARIHADAHYVSDLVAAVFVAVGVEHTAYCILKPPTASASPAKKEGPWCFVGLVIGVLTLGVTIASLRGFGVSRIPSKQLTMQQRLDIVGRLYLRGLGRVPTADEKQVFVDRLAQLPEAEVGLVKEFGLCTEFYQRLNRSIDTMQRVTWVYRLMYDREPTDDEATADRDRLMGNGPTLRREIRLLVLRLSYASADQ